MNEETPTIPTDQEATEIASGASLLETIQKRREERLDYLEIDIPSWGGDLKARYEVVPRDELNAMLKKLSTKATKESDKGDLDFLIRACTTVVAVNVEGDGEDVEVSNGYTQALADRLGVATTTARELVRYMFKDNGIAVAAQAQKVANWMTDPSADQGEDALGM